MGMGYERRMKTRFVIPIIYLAVTLTLPAVRFLGQKIERNTKHLIEIRTNR